MSEEMMLDYEVIVGTSYTQEKDRELAIAEASRWIVEAFSQLAFWRVNVYGGDGENYGIGFNVEVPEDMVSEFEDSMGPVVESIERI